MKTKGRLRSVDTTTGTMVGIVFGGVIGGVPGIIVGAAAGQFVARRFGITNEIGVLKQIAFTTKVMLLNQLRIANYGLSMFTGMKVLKGANFEKHYGDKVDAVDINNMKANMMHISVLLTNFGLFLLTKSLLWDDDDEKDSMKRQLHNVLINTSNALNDEIAIYLSPTQTAESLLGSIAPVQFLGKIITFADDIYDYVNGEDLILTGINAGESKLGRSTSKLLLPAAARGGLGFGEASKRVYNPSKTADWFKNDETINKQKLRRLKAEARSQLGVKDIENDDVVSSVESVLNKRFRKKKTITYSQHTPKVKADYDKIISEAQSIIDSNL